MSSNEIAMMMSQQTSMFAGQQQFAQQIVPGGFGGGMTGPGMGGGNRFAGAAMSAGGGAATAAGMGLGVASMFGKLGAAAPLLDPLAGGMAGFARFGMAGAIGGAALPIGIGMAASQAVGSVIHGGQQQQMITNQLGQFNFFNPSSRSGSGFTRQDSSAIGEQIRSLAHVPEMMTSVEELTKLLPKLKGSGMMQGVRDATEFAQRFKDSIKTIRDVSRTLGTSMEEAAEFFAHSRSVGFLGRQAQMQNVMNAQFTSGVTGMSMSSVMQMQQTGANMAQQFGARRSLGASAVTNNAQMLGLAQQTGRIKDGALEDITGLQGDEAVRATAERMTGIVANIARSTAVGRLSVAGMTKFDAQGKAIGMDEELVKRYREGSLSKDELQRRAGSMTQSQKVSFTARAADLSMDFASKAGPGGVSGLLSEAAGSLGYGNTPEAVNVLLQRNGGASSGEADVMQSMQGMGGMDGMKGAMARLKAQEARIRERTDPREIIGRLKRRVEGATTKHLEDAGGKIFTAMGQAYDDFIDDLLGRHVVQLSQEGANNFARAMAGGNRSELKAMFAAAHGQKSGGPGGMQGPSAFGKASGLAMLAGGPLGLAAGGMGLAADLAFQNRGALGDSEAAAFLRRGDKDTGRSAAGELSHFQGLLGAGRAGLSDRGTKFGGQGAAAEALDRVRAGIDNFRGMDDARKLDELRSGVSSTINAGLAVSFNSDTRKMDDVRAAARGDESALKRLGGEAGFEKALTQMNSSDAGRQAAALLRAGRAGSKNLGIADLSTAVIAAGQTGLSDKNSLRVHFRDVASAGAANQFKDVAAAAKAMKEADAKLEDAIGGPAAAALKDKPAFKKAVRQAQSSKAVRDAINEGDVTELAKHGIDVKAEDIGTLQSTLDAVDKNKTEALGAILDHENAQRGSDMVVMKNQALDAAAELSKNASSMTGAEAHAVNGLSRALTDFGKDPSEKSFAAVQSQITALTKQAQKLGPGAKRSALLSAAGAIGAGIEGQLSKGTTLSGNKATREQLAEGLGVGAEDVSSILQGMGQGSTSSISLNKGVIDDLQARAAGMKGAAGLVGKGGDARGAGDRDSAQQKLIDALTGINKVNDQQNTLLQNMTGQSKSLGDTLASVFSASKDNGSASSTGDTKPGGT